MPLERKLEQDEIALGLCIVDRFLFAILFFDDDLTKEPSHKQKLMLCDQSDRILLCTGRKVWKTGSEERDVFYYSLNNDRKSGLDEALFCTPRMVHLAPVRDRIWARSKMPFFNLFVDSRTKTPPASLQFHTNLKWHFRIEGHSGTDETMAGIRAKYVLGDEMAFGNHICHQSRVMTARPGAKWRYSGVPNGVRGTPFYALDQTEMGDSWSRHKMTTFDNPIYDSPAQREQLEKDYRGRNTQAYINFVEGQWGAEYFSSFPPGSIAMNDSIPYVYIERTGGQLGGDVEAAINLLLSELPPVEGIKRAALGWDYGFSPDPADISLAYERGDNVWYQLFRLRLLRVTQPHQCQIIRAIMDRYGVEAVSSDNQGAIQSLDAGKRGFWAPPHSKVTLTDEDGDPLLDEDAKPITMHRKDWITERLRLAMQAAKMGVKAPFTLWLGHDTYVENELAGTIERKRSSGQKEYIAPLKTPGSKSPDDHATDSLRFMVQSISLILEREGLTGDNLKDQIAAMGWVNTGSERTWKAPWG